MDLEQLTAQVVDGPVATSSAMGQSMSSRASSIPTAP